MSGEKNIPTKLNKFNVYNEAERLIGVGEEVTLPDFEAISETISGAGILGEIDDPTIGQFSNQEMEIPFRVLDPEAINMMDMTKAVQLTLRGAIQTVNGNGDIEVKGIRVVVRGRAKKLTGGKLKSGSPMESGVTLTLIYILIELDGKTKLVLDKFGEKYEIDGVNQLSKIEELC